MVLGVNVFAKYGMTSVAWFFGLKISIVINDEGELMAVKITRGDCHDSQVEESLFITPVNIATAILSAASRVILQQKQPFIFHEQISRVYTKKCLLSKDARINKLIKSPGCLY